SKILLVLSNKYAATVAISNTNQTYNGTARSVSASTTPTGLSVTLTYSGSTNAPTNAGSYLVLGSVDDALYQGSATAALTISQAVATVTLGNLSQTYDGTPRIVSAVTSPPDLPVSFTYNSLPTPPINAGSYTVIGTISDGNYRGSATNTLAVSQA